MTASVALDAFEGTPDVRGVVEARAVSGEFDMHTNVVVVPYSGAGMLSVNGSLHSKTKRYKAKKKRAKEIKFTDRQV